MMVLCNEIDTRDTVFGVGGKNVVGDGKGVCTSKA